MSIEILSTGAGVDAAAGASTRRAAARGELLRLRRGDYVETTSWNGASHHDRHRALVHALMQSQPDDLIVSHASAVALLGLPWIGSFGERLVVSDPARDRGQVKATMQRVGTASRVPDTVRIDGMAVTSPVVTAVDVALREHPWRAIVVLDAVLRRGVSTEALLTELEQRGAARARVRARDLIEHADAAAESPGESITRWGAHVLGAPVPVLQYGFPNDWGGTERVDLFFPGSGTVVEFDGVAKYTDPRYNGGRSSQDVVVAEKRREDRLRAQPDVRGFARVGWSDAMPGGQLPRRLVEAGVPLSRNWGSAWRAAAVRAL